MRGGLTGGQVKPTPVSRALSSAAAVQGAEKRGDWYKTKELVQKGEAFPEPYVCATLLSLMKWWRLRGLFILDVCFSCQAPACR